MQQNLKEIEIDTKTLPIILKLVYNGVEKDYILKTNKEGSCLILNKKEEY